MRILQRYLLKEMTANFIGVTVVLFAILFVNQIGAVLARAAQLSYPSSVLLELIGLGAVQNISLLLPIGLLLGIVLAFGRLYHDSEMTAAQACGIGLWRVSTPVWLLAIPVTAAITLLNFDLAPRAAAQQAALRSEALRAGMLAPLEPGKFRSFAGGRIVVYARRVTAAGELQDVFVNQNRGTTIESTVAQRAHYAIAGDGQTEAVTLFDGERLEGVPGSHRYRILRFEQQIIPVNTPAADQQAARPDELSTAQLLASGDPKSRAELHWRAGLPIMALVLTALAVPLGRLRPRQGRYTRVWIAVLIFALYANLAVAGQAWLERGTVDPRLGLWWIHGSFLGVALLWNVLPQQLRRMRARRHRP